MMGFTRASKFREQNHYVFKKLDELVYALVKRLFKNHKGYPEINLHFGTTLMKIGANGDGLSQLQLCQHPRSLKSRGHSVLGLAVTII